MFKDIMCGDTVYFSTRHSKELKGKAVMKGPVGWVVNIKGTGIATVVTEKNFIKIRKGRNRRPDILGGFVNGV
jgi:hypothetical protein|tara:strand:+ start:412 stop:630 length:219 start_codon:yes stop_codon:yes gene_type:complete